MKTKIILFFLLVMAVNAFVSTSVKAQENEKETLYNFAYSHPQIAYISDPYPKILFVSPVVECEFNEDEYTKDDYNNLDYVWEQKVEATFPVEDMIMVTDPWLWRSRSEVEEERNKTIIEFKDDGYKVYQNYLFSFYYECVSI